MVGMIYVGDHLKLLDIKYNIYAVGFMVSEQDFLNFPHYKSAEVNDPRGMTSLDPRGVVGRIYIRYH